MLRHYQPKQQQSRQKGRPAPAATTTTTTQPATEETIRPQSNESQSLSEIGSSTEDEQPRKERKPRVARVAPESELLIIEGAIKMALQATAAMLPMVTKDQRDGIVILQAEEALVQQIMLIAKNDKAVRKYLLMMAQQSGYAGLAVVVAFKVVLPIMNNHKMRPPLFTPEAPSPNEQGVSANGYGSTRSN